MIKTTIKEAKNKAQFTDLANIKRYLKEQGEKVKHIEKVAYTIGIYGCNGYLLRIQTNKGYFYAFTGRSSWMYNCTSNWVYNED